MVKLDVKLLHVLTTCIHEELVSVVDEVSAGLAKLIIIDASAFTRNKHFLFG